MVNQAGKRRARKLKPVSGTARWIAKPSGPTLWGRLSITNVNNKTTEYDFEAIREGEKIVGFGLVKDDDEIYDIEITRYGWQCNCPDACWSDRECKHVKAIRAALAHLGINVPNPEEIKHAPSCPWCEKSLRDCDCFDR
jgi:hypothetical protein